MPCAPCPALPCPALPQVIDGVMRQLLSKDLMYEPTKMICQKFPEWLAVNKVRPLSTHLAPISSNPYLAPIESSLAVNKVHPLSTHLAPISSNPYLAPI